jgi:hypothetical protein
MSAKFQLSTSSISGLSFLVTKCIHSCVRARTHTHKHVTRYFNIYRLEYSELRVWKAYIWKFYVPVFWYELHLWCLISLCVH